MNKKYWVYILLLPNGKRYVGCTTATRTERRGHNYRKDFTETCLKFGWENIQRTSFEVYSKEEMYYLERYLIAYYSSLDPEHGYNLSPGGPGCGRGLKRSEESRENYKTAQQKRAQDLEFRKKLSKRLKGIPRKPRSKFLWTLPDGTEKILSSQAAHQHYIHRGINIVKGPRVI